MSWSVHRWGASAPAFYRRTVPVRLQQTPGRAVAGRAEFARCAGRFAARTSRASGDATARFSPARDPCRSRHRTRPCLAPCPGLNVVVPLAPTGWRPGQRQASSLRTQEGAPSLFNEQAARGASAAQQPKQQPCARRHGGISGCPVPGNQSDQRGVSHARLASYRRNERPRHASRRRPRRPAPPVSRGSDRSRRDAATTSAKPAPPLPSLVVVLSVGYLAFTSWARG